MKKFNGYALLVLVLAIPLFSFAEEIPQMARGNPMIHGGGVGFDKAEGDTINLMAATNDPTNNLDPRDGGLEPYYDGDFQDDDGDPCWNGWTHRDLTGPTETHWNVSNYNQPNPSNHAAWCGDINFPSCGILDPDGGYGNNWHDLLEFRQAVPYPGSSSTVTVTATLTHDTEPEYDFVLLSNRHQGQPMADIQSWEGTDTVTVSKSVDYLPEEYMDGTDIALYFRFRSDSGWSDEDCLFASAGGCQVDDINVHLVNGVFTGDYFEDFEHGGDPDDFGLWNVAFPDGVGDFAQIWTGLVDADPCNYNDTPQVAFIDDGLVVPSTGGSQCVNWCYGPGGYIVNTTGGLAGPAEHIHNVIESPVMAWPSAKDPGGADYDGIFFEFDVYVHEDLTPDAPGIFYTWGVRSADTDGSAGNGVQDIFDQGWRDRDIIYFDDPTYRRDSYDVTDLMNQGRDEIQVQLAVYELGWFWGWVGNDGYPAPYFDNVTVKIFPTIGPVMSAWRIRLAQDNFPTRGSIEPGDLGSHSVRFDMAWNISPLEHNRNDPGDSLVVDIVPVRSGSDFDGDPELHYLLAANPVFDPFRTSGLPDQGFLSGMPAVGISGTPDPSKWAFDLPDTGFLFPGDVLHYYINAVDAIGGVGGENPQTSLMPADTSGFSHGFGDPLAYPPLFTVHALPSIREDGFGGYEQPGILFVNNFADHGGENHWYFALNNLGLRVNEDYDVYYVNGDDTGYGNSLGGRASGIMLMDYHDILFTSGKKQVGAISPSDVRTLTDWVEQGDKDIFLTGDGLANTLSPSGDETLTFLEEIMGVTLVTSNISPYIGNQTTPLVQVIPGNPVFLPTSSLSRWIAFGGCENINYFDGVNPYDTGQRLAEFHDPLGAGYSFSAATLNILNPGLYQSRVVSMPVDLMFVFTDPSASGHPLPARAQLLRDVLEYFNISGSSENVSGTGSVPKIAFTTSNYPNPFNPSTTIKYSMPREGHLALSIFNVRGQLVRTLIDGNRPAGADQIIVWDGTDNFGSGVSSGVYFLEARTGGEVKVQKMALVK